MEHPGVLACCLLNEHESGHEALLGWEDVCGLDCWCVRLLVMDVSLVRCESVGIPVLLCLGHYEGLLGVSDVHGFERIIVVGVG